MEIDENVESKSDKSSAASTLHTTQSQPVLLDTAEGAHSSSPRKSSKNRRVSFATSSHLAQYLEPINPFKSHEVPVSSSEELSNLYRVSCDRHKTTPIPAIIEHLEKMNFEKSTSTRTEVLNLRQQTLSHESCEALEELFKRVKYKLIDVTSCSLDDVSATSLFDMIEYYEACNELNISENANIKNRGWLACINMIKRSQALHSLSTRGTPISDSNAIALGNALLSSFLYTLKLEHCTLSGRPILLLSGALQKNKMLKELCLANNDLTHNDAFHIGNMLKNNYHLQLLDISNNDIQDEGFRHIAEALSYQSVHVSKTSSADSLSSSSINKFDFADFTTNLNNINNNRNRFSPTPPPMRNVTHHAVALGGNNNNNNSILQCDNDNKPNESPREEAKPNEVTVSGSRSESELGASTNSLNESPVISKFKYTTDSLSPISHAYDDTTTNHTLFNSPERSFSSESLCSETSVESNDSKSSIRLIESKFNSSKNGTLERQHNSVSYKMYEDAAMKQATGLQVLILWNNNLTPISGASAAELIECTEYLQIINFGQNPIGDTFIDEIRPALKSNESITSMGLQATNLTCESLKILADVLQFSGNSTLQRIDLRNNNLSVSGLSALSEALKSNKSVMRIDIDDAPKSDEMLPLKNSEYQQLVSTIREQCEYNENPPEAPKQPAVTAAQKVRKANLGTRKISLTCSSAKVLPKQQLLEPIKKQANNRLRSPSPTPSPLSPLLTSPSRSRFQVSRVSESSSGVSSKSPSSSSSSPTFFPSSNSRFRVVTIAEPATKKQDPSPIQPPVPLKVVELKSEATKEIDIPAPNAKPFCINVSSSSSIASSQSCEQLDYEIKKFIDLDSCSSFSSSIDSIDRQTDVSSTESFDMIEKSPTNKCAESEEVKRDIFSNENTLTVSTSSSSSSSNEGLTLTTNSPTELSPKHASAETSKRTRKTSWIHTAIGASKNSNSESSGTQATSNTSTNTYPATLDKLINLFHHPTSIFTKTSPDNSTATSSPSSSNKLSKASQAKEEKTPGMGQKENSISGFIHSLVSLTTHKKDEKTLSSNDSSSTILQNISPENTFGKSSPSQTFLESLPKSIKKELKENISPENTISNENMAGIDKQKVALGSKVLFVVGDEESIDLASSSDEILTVDDTISDDILFESHSLGEITRDSMTILKPHDDE